MDGVTVSARPPAEASLEKEACNWTVQCVENDLGWALGAVLRRFQQAVKAVLCDVPSGHRGYQLLAMAGGQEPRRQLTLAHELGIDRTVMTYLLDDMEKAGLVERQPDPADRRARLIAVTPAGRELMAKVQDGLAEAENRVLAALPETERRQFRELLQRLAMDAGAAAAAPPPECV